VARFERAHQDTIGHRRCPVEDPGAYSRGAAPIGYVTQEGSLFPALTWRDTSASGLPA